ncbi:MAG: hypothetical protein KAH86_03100 [Methanosarcinales archaeon]|nr:hypothetical protein [Methanosarcinales archaeon]
MGVIECRLDVVVLAISRRALSFAGVVRVTAGRGLHSILAYIRPPRFIILIFNHGAAKKSRR